jgi:hypothetical protein
MSGLKDDMDVITSNTSIGSPIYERQRLTRGGLVIRNLIFYMSEVGRMLGTF